MGVGLAALVTGVTVKRQRLGQAGSGGRVIPGRVLQFAQRAERVGLAEAVSGLARRGQGGLVEGG